MSYMTSSLQLRPSPASPFLASCHPATRWDLSTAEFFPKSHGPARCSSLQMASVINSALDLYFPEGCGVDILAELGRYYVTSAFTVAVSIVAKREVLDQASREGGCGARWAWPAKQGWGLLENGYFL